DSDRLDRDRRLAVGWRGDLARILGTAPAPAGALLRRDFAIAGAARTRAAGNRPAQHACNACATAAVAAETAHRGPGLAGGRARARACRAGGGIRTGLGGRPAAAPGATR